VKEGTEAEGSSGVLDLGWKMRKLLLFLLSAMLPGPLGQADGQYPGLDQHSNSTVALTLRLEAPTERRTGQQIVVSLLALPSMGRSGCDLKCGQDR